MSNRTSELERAQELWVEQRMKREKNGQNAGRGDVGVSPVGGGGGGSQREDEGRNTGHSGVTLTSRRAETECPSLEMNKCGIPT